MKIFLVVLSALAVLTVAGCGNPVLQQRGPAADCPAPALPPCPPAPILDVQPGEQGGICLDGDDARELMLYIRSLEQNCQEGDT